MTALKKTAPPTQRSHARDGISNVDGVYLRLSSDWVTADESSKRLHGARGEKNHPAELHFTSSPVHAPEWYHEEEEEDVV